jgi:thiol-disulfide isomerase/thioredoxin
MDTTLANLRATAPAAAGSRVPSREVDVAIHAPALPTDAVWLNVERPLTPADLAGRLVLLHFWTYACINCQHALQSLATIERALEGEPFLIVSIHSPKFPTQREAEMVREAVAQLEVTHPVVLDPDAGITQSFAVNGWPTMIFVGPDGTILGTGRGEPEPQALLGAIRQALATARAQGLLAAPPDPLPLKPTGPGSGPGHRLAFPGAVVAGTVGGREVVVVADPGHHQVVVSAADGAELGRLGSGVAGFDDGPAGEARLRRPCGLALAGDTLYIADTGNHAVRAVDLATDLATDLAGGLAGGIAGGIAGAVVTTVAGGPLRPPSAPGRPLRSPWGLAWDGHRLFIAAAGTHQLWIYDPATAGATVFAGTGAEGGRDGPASAATFAQPSGLALLDGALYVTDAETSSIRAVTDLNGSPQVRTICGAGDLFGFGDRDGAGPGAELQHPIGLAAGPPGAGRLFVADTFNHKVREVNPVSGRCWTLFGNGDSELDPLSPAGSALAPAGPGRPALCAPEGVAWQAGGLLIADTGNHRLLSVGLGDGARRVLIGGEAPAV